MRKILFGVALITTSLTSFADKHLTININAVDENGVGVLAGQVEATPSKYGVVFTPALKGLPPGLHGFHMHENASCMPKEKDGKMTTALGAGGHFDPKKTGRHSTPWGDGHLGDLPPLFVDADGNATQPVLAPRLKISDIKGHALVIHKGGDNHEDHPAALGGGGPRIFCGVI